jgi:hypothetical protein
MIEEEHSSFLHAMNNKKHSPVRVFGPAKISLVWIFKSVVETEEVAQVMKLGFVNFALKVKWGWIAKAVSDESH